MPTAGLRLGSLLEAAGALKSPAVRRLAVVGSSLFPCVWSAVMWAWVLQTSSWTDPQAGSWSGFLDGTRCVGRGWVTAKALPLGDTPRHVSHSMAGGFPDSRAGQRCGVSPRQPFPAPAGQCRSVRVGLGSGAVVRGGLGGSVALLILTCVASSARVLQERLTGLLCS